MNNIKAQDGKWKQKEKMKNAVFMPAGPIFDSIPNLSLIKWLQWTKLKTEPISPLRSIAFVSICY